MSKIELLANALEYLEEHLMEDIKTEEVAKACFCSKSTLEKLFRGINHLTVHDYIVRRKMMKAAWMLMENPQENVLNVALRVGYGSNEAFSRAFKQVWNCQPSQFRKNNRYTELFPRLRPPMEIGDDYVKTRKQVDISELYDLFKERKDCYFVCCDVHRQMDINAISRAAGDLALIETLNRLNEVAGEEDVVFRIGGDEFVLLTACEDEAYAQNVMNQIVARNGEPIVYEGQEIPLKLHVGITKTENKRLKYHDLFQELHIAIKDIRKSDV